MKIVINPEFEYLRTFIESIPQNTYTAEETFCQKRNTVEKISAGNKQLVVKKYKRPTLANCVIYTWFRKNKAQRSYIYAQKLLKAGIETATPVAYIEIYKYGFFHTGYFISEFLPYPLMTETDHLEEEEKKQIGANFVEYTVHLHKNGIIHPDYNKSNILYHKKGGKYQFALIDINRIHFGRATVGNCIKAINTLGLQFDQLIILITKYADLRKWDIQNSLAILLLIKKSAKIKMELKQWMKNTVNQLNPVKKAESLI